MNAQDAQRLRDLSLMFEEDTDAIIIEKRQLVGLLDDRIEALDHLDKILSLDTVCDDPRACRDHSQVHKFVSERVQSWSNQYDRYDRSKE